MPVPRRQEWLLTIFKWLLVPASVLVVLGVVVFVLADLNRMTTVRSVALSVIAIACLLTLAAGLIAWYERPRR